MMDIENLKDYNLYWRLSMIEIGMPFESLK